MPLKTEETIATSMSLSALLVPLIYDPNNNTSWSGILLAVQRSIYFLMVPIGESSGAAMFLFPQFVPFLSL